MPSPRTKPILFGLALASVTSLASATAVAQPQLILNPRGYKLSQPGLPTQTIPAVETLSSAKDFYNYYSASSHTGFEQMNRSLMFFHRDVSKNPPPLSLIITHGIDKVRNGPNQPTAEVDMDITGLPPQTYVSQSDDNANEFRKTEDTIAIGRWWFRSNTDGGVLSGFPDDQNWTLNIDIDLVYGINEWQYFYANGMNLNLDPNQPVTVEYDAPPSYATYSVEGDEGVPITICATVVSTTGMPASYTWTWKDQGTNHTTTGTTTSDVEAICDTYTFDEDGVYEVELSANDGSGTGTVTTRVLVNNTDGGGDNVVPLQDDFTGEWKECLWEGYQRYGGDTYREGDPGYDPNLNTIRNNRLNLAIPSQYLAGMDWETGLESSYMLGGNFDVQVNFELPDEKYWTNLDVRGISALFVELMANDAGARRRQIRNSQINPNTTQAVFNPHLWVANHSQNRVSQIDTDNAVLLGSYGTGSSPSRTAVDLVGNVWINHRCDGSIWRIRASECTPPSCSVAEVNASYKDRFTTTYSNGRCNGGGAAVDKNNDPWIGFLNDRRVVKLDQSTGQVVESVGAGGRVYGLAADVNDYIWSDNHWDGNIDKIDSITGTKIATYRPSDGLCFRPYGIAVDSFGKIWNAHWGNCPYITRFDPVTETFDRFTAPDGGSTLNHNRGIAADNQGLIWTVSSTRSKLSVYDMETGAYITKYNTCGAPSGVALDRNNRIWVTCINGWVYQHDRDGTVLADIYTGSNTYSYSDMTGYQLRNFGSDAWQESFLNPEETQEDTYYTSSIENNYGGGIEDGVGGDTAIDPNQAPVENLATSSGNKYELNRIRFGELYYTDRLFRIISQPTDLEGLWGLRTPDGDRFNKDPNLVTMTAKEDIDVYVAYDADAPSLPAWLDSNYVPVDDDADGEHDYVQTTNGSPLYRLYKKEFNVGDTITLGGNLANASGASTSRFASCAEIFRNDPLAPSGDYTINTGVGGDQTVYCDMDSDGGVGHTLKRINLPAAQANSASQADYIAACQAIGMEVIVPRSKSHARTIVSKYGEPPNIVNVNFEDTEGNVSFLPGQAGLIGECRNQLGEAVECPIYLTDSNDTNCGTNINVAAYPQKVGGSSTALMVRSAGPSAGCEFGKWPTNGDVPAGSRGWVMCSTNDALIPNAASCDEIAFNGSQHSAGQGISGVYELTSPGGVTYQTYCDMHLDGGGWTLGIQTNGRSTVMNYDSDYWENGALLNTNEPWLHGKDSKLYSFLDVPFNELMVAMTNLYTSGSNLPIGYNTYNRVTMSKTASSMLAMFQGSNNQSVRATNESGVMDRNAWKSLLPNSSLQSRCNRQAVNNYHHGARVRVGILGNQENDCNSPDSRLGIGGRGTYCGQNNNVAAGNSARCSPDNGDKDIFATAALFGRRKPANLVGHWSFNGNSQDSSGNGLHAVLADGNRGFCAGTAGTQYGSGLSALGTNDQALEFDGCDDYAYVPNSPKLSSDSVTISLWVYVDSAKWNAQRDNANNWRSLLRKTNSTAGTATGYDIVLEEWGPRSLAFDTGHAGGRDRWWPNRMDVPLDKWTHVAFSYDANTGTKYAWLDGRLLDTKNITLGPLRANNDNLYFSNAAWSFPPAGSGSVPGSIDEVRIYDGLIPENNILQLSGTARGAELSNYFAYFRPKVFSTPPPALSEYTIIEDPVLDADDQPKDDLNPRGRLRVVRTASVWSFYYADEVTDPTVWKRMGDPMELGDQDVRLRLRTRLDPFWHSGPVNNPGGALNIQYDDFKVNLADEVIGAPTETCNGLDDDCDGFVDENYPGKFDACDTGLPGICKDGYLDCEAGGLVCKRINNPGPEICDGIDNDCNGVIDDYVVGGETADGTYVNTGDSCEDDALEGPCRGGQFVCQTGVMVCQGAVQPGPDICDGIDNDCDGLVDNTAGHIFTETGHFITAKSRMTPYFWPRPLRGSQDFATYAAYDGTNSTATFQIPNGTTVDIHDQRRARVIFYLDETLADAANPAGKYILWLTQGKADPNQGAVTAEYAIRHSGGDFFNVILNDSDESNINAGSSDRYQQYVLTSEAGTTGGIAIGPLPSAQPWEFELSATFQGDIDSWDLFNPETLAHVELNPAQKFTFENQPIPAGGITLTADSGMPCTVAGEQGICAQGTGFCGPGGIPGCNKTVVGLPHEICDGQDNNCDGDVDEAENMVFARVEVKQDGNPELDDWTWAPTINNGISAEESLSFVPEAGDDRVGSAEMPSSEDASVSIQKVDSSVVAFHRDQRTDDGSISMPLLIGKRVQDSTSSNVPGATDVELKLKSKGAPFGEAFTSFYDDRAPGVDDKVPADYKDDEFKMEFELRRSTSGSDFVREADSVVVRDIAEEYTTAGSEYELKVDKMGNLDKWEFYRPYRPVIELDEDKKLEVRTELTSNFAAQCVIQNHPTLPDECNGEVSRYICVNGQVECKTNPAGCCKDRDGDGFYGYDAVSCDVGTDCDDTDEDIFPGAAEICDGVDNNCGGILTTSGAACDRLPSQPNYNPACNVVDEIFPEQGTLCTGSLDADGNPDPNGGFERDLAGNIISVMGECSAEYVCQGGALGCDVRGTPTAEICDGLDNDCDGAVDTSYLAGSTDPNVPSRCLADDVTCGPQECEYQDVCVCQGGPGADNCFCRVALSPAEREVKDSCPPDTFFDGTSCVFVCSGDNTCGAGHICDPVSRACVPAPAQDTAEVPAQGCSSAGNGAPADLGLAALAMLGLVGLRRRKR